MRARSGSLLLLPLVLLAACADTRSSGTSDLRSLLIGGTWARHLDEKLFFPDGTYESHDRAHDQPTHGTWRLDGRTLSMTEGGETTAHRILTITETYLEMTFRNGSAGLMYHRSPR
jgi:hypothetical protein